MARPARPECAAGVSGDSIPLTQQGFHPRQTVGCNCNVCGSCWATGRRRIMLRCSCPSAGVAHSPAEDPGMHMNHAFRDQSCPELKTVPSSAGSVLSRRGIDWQVVGADCAHANAVSQLISCWLKQRHSPRCARPRSSGASWNTRRCLQGAEWRYVACSSDLL